MDFFESKIISTRFPFVQFFLKFQLNNPPGIFGKIISMGVLETFVQARIFKLLDGKTFTPCSFVSGVKAKIYR